MDGDDPRRFQGSVASDDLVQVQTGKILHREKEGAVVGAAEVEYLDRVGMLERGKIRQLADAGRNLAQRNSPKIVDR